MDKETQEIYFDQLDQFIETANAASEDKQPGLVSSTLLHAAARYSAFYLASCAESRKDLIADKDDTVERVTREFKRLFAQELEDYIENYKVYMRE